MLLLLHSWDETNVVALTKASLLACTSRIFDFDKLPSLVVDLMAVGCLMKGFTTAEDGPIVEVSN